MATPKTTGYVVLSALKHDGKRYKKGSTVVLTEAQATPLLNLGIIEAAKAEAAK